MSFNAPYTGGYSPDAQLFAVDGDFTVFDPAGLPVISFPMMGDSVLSTNDVVTLDLFNDAGILYITVPLGIPPNVQPWSANQKCMILEQDFIGAQSAYLAMPLNTPYNPNWATGWQTGKFLTVDLDELYLIKEGDLIDLGGGLCKIKRTWSSLPPTRNEVEQFAYNFPGFGQTNALNAGRQSRILNVTSRIQYDYYIFDDLNILSIPIFPEGHRLNSGIGIYPSGFIMNQTYYFITNKQDDVSSNNFIDSLSDSVDMGTATLPSLSTYISWINGHGTIDGKPAELIAEGSILTRWRGNIFERRTRFVLAQ